MKSTGLFNMNSTCLFNLGSTSPHAHRRNQEQEINRENAPEQADAAPAFNVNSMCAEGAESSAKPEIPAADGPLEFFSSDQLDGFDNADVVSEPAKKELATENARGVESANMSGGLGDCAPDSAMGGEAGVWGRRARGGITGGAEFSNITAIDLSKPGDAMLVRRAVLNGWDTPEHIQDQVTDQLVSAMDTHRARGECSRSTGQKCRSIGRIIMLARLALLMDATCMIAEGCPRSRFPYLRRRYPDKRSPRRLTASSALSRRERALAELAKLNPELAERIRARVNRPGNNSTTPAQNHLSQGLSFEV